MKGNVKFYNESKGFGFITAEDGKDYFVHISGIPEGLELRDEDAVTFDIEEGDRGPKAVNIALDTGSSEAEVSEAESSEADSE